ncbi:MAG: hypothetical protein OXI87_12080 [Albidovulum sp.]|nr:hypothetical protein [Albidovulum sp.]MDE0533679.1 hypothetical protein [Albidovulum sp.]
MTGWRGKMKMVPGVRFAEFLGKDLQAASIQQNDSGTPPISATIILVFDWN